MSITSVTVREPDFGFGCIREGIANEIFIFRFHKFQILHPLILLLNLCVFLTISLNIS